MAKKKVKVERFISPKGKAQWAHLVEPDDYEGKKKFKVNQIFPEDECTEFMDFLRGKAQEAFDELTAELKPAVRKKATLYLPFEEVCDDETGEETGDIKFKFSSNAEYTDKKTKKLIQRKVRLVDAAGNIIKDTTGLKIGNGSLIKVCYSCYPFHNPSSNEAGVSLRIEKVQIVHLEEWSGSDTDNEFGAEEGGYTYAAPEVPEDDGADDDFGDEDGAAPEGGDF